MEDLIMKAATVIAVAVAAFSSFPSTAQPKSDGQPAQALISPQQNPSPGTSPSSSAQEPGQPTNPQSRTESQGTAANTSAVRLEPVKGELVGKLDSNSTKQGDSVVIQTEESVKTASGTEIPKGSKLVGHVTNVMARGDGKQNSQIAIQFDHAELKGGQNLQIESVIQSLAPASGEETSNSMAPASGAPTGGAAMGGAPMSGAPGAAGSQPNMPNGSAVPNPGMNNNTANQSTMNNRPSMAGSMAQPGTPGQNTNSGTPAPGSIVARNGNVAIRTTSIPGVLIANDINGRPFSNASGLLLGARRDIKLDGGTQMVVGVAEAPSGTGR
jgi:hypothetical protein